MKGSIGAIAAALCAAMGLALAAVTPARADTGETASATFYPLFVQGSLVGCQLAFSVRRRDEEFGQGRPTAFNGLLVFHGPRAERVGVLLRLGVADAPFQQFHPPERAFLLDGLQSNASEAGGSFLSDTAGFRVFTFEPGATTLSAITGLATDATLMLTYGMPGSIVDARVGVDLRDFPDVLQDWADCLVASLQA